MYQFIQFKTIQHLPHLVREVQKQVIEREDTIIANKLLIFRAKVLLPDLINLEIICIDDFLIFLK